MKKLDKIISLVIFIVIGVGVIYVSYITLSPYIYTTDYKNKTECLDNDTYIALNNVILKKYEVVLFGDIDNLYELYSYNNKKAIKTYENSKNHLNLKEQFETMQINNIYKLNSTIYLVEYDVNYYDNQKISEKIVIKYSNNKACIFSDTMLGV